MLRDKIRRRGFSDKTVKDYLSFGRPMVICYQNGFRRVKKNAMTGMERWWKKDGGEKKEWRAWVLKIEERGGGMGETCHAGRILFSV